MDTTTIDSARGIARDTLDASLDVVDDAQARLDQLHRSGRWVRRLGRLALAGAAIGAVVLVVALLRRRASAPSGPSAEWELADLDPDRA